VAKTEEKGSDVNLATFLLLDAFQRDCDAAVMMSNDSDLKLPIEVAQRELRMRIGVVNPHPPARRSRALEPTFFIRGLVPTARDDRPASGDEEDGAKRPRDTCFNVNAVLAEVRRTSAPCEGVPLPLGWDPSLVEPERAG
jgi:hypothetical protein